MSGLNNGNKVTLVRKKGYPGSILTKFQKHQTDPQITASKNKVQYSLKEYKNQTLNINLQCREFSKKLPGMGM